MSPVVHQPQTTTTTTRSCEWQTKLCDCGSDWPVCLYGTFCHCCLACEVAEDMGECCCVGGFPAMRTRYRTLYHIPGSICSDCLTAIFCGPCSTCQLKRDIKKRKELGIF